MIGTWSDTDAVRQPGGLGECVYASRLIGADESLVLHGGGNSSVKERMHDIRGRDLDVIHVKGSGWDMATIEPAGFSTLRLAAVRALLELDELSDGDMMRELSAAKVDPSGPQPSVETLLHALLPHPAVLHSHADAVIALTNAADGAGRVEAALGDRVLIVPYVMPGFRLARVVRELVGDGPAAGVEGIVLLNHGLFTFGTTSREAYERHISLLAMAEQWLMGAGSGPAPSSLSGSAAAASAAPLLPEAQLVELATLRAAVSRVAGRSMIMTRGADADATRFVRRPDLAVVATRGPLTPDHVLHTKRIPQVGRDVDAYAHAYQAYFEANRGRVPAELTMLDPAPRVILDPLLGILAVGPTVRRASIAADLYRHTAAVIERVENGSGGYVALPASDVFDVEYWELEQAKLWSGGSDPELAGQVAFVTGAASGIGRGCAEALLDRGAAVVGIDISPAVANAFTSPAWLGVVADTTDQAAVAAAIRAGVERFGGIDIAVIAAGVFGATTPIAAADQAVWEAVLSVNLHGALTVLRLTHPLLALAPGGGKVVVIGSRNVAAPGPGVAAYSASKAALTQLARVAALEWAPDGIRVNVVHPDAVFDTGLWTDDILEARAAQYGLPVEAYRRRNLLGREITSASVGRLVADLCGESFANTTGAQIPIDGGNERVI